MEHNLKDRPKPPFEMIPDTEKWNDWIEECLQWFEGFEKELLKKLATTKWNDPYHERLVTDLLKEILG